MLHDDIDERYDLEAAVWLQLCTDITLQDTNPLVEWLQHLSDECLLHYLPSDHHMFKGLREDSVPEWYKTVPYVFNDDYVDDTIGRN
jgi:hypothetical protein